MFSGCLEGSVPRSVRFDDQRNALRFGPFAQDGKQFIPDGEAPFILNLTGDEDRTLEACKLLLDGRLIGNDMVVCRGNLPAAQVRGSCEDRLGKSTLNKFLPELEHQGGFPACAGQADDSMQA